MKGSLKGTYLDETFIGEDGVYINFKPIKI